MTKSNLLISSGSLRDRPQWRPTNVLFWGRRGKGKSLMMRVMLEILAPGLFRHHWRIQSNIHMTFPRYPDWFCRCSPFLPDRLNLDMDSAYHSELAIDEITEFVPARSAMTRVNKSAASFVRQLRKLGCEITSTTQFPTDVDRMMLRQIDLYCLVESHISDWARFYPEQASKAYVDVYVFDVWGQFTGNGEASRYWPPPIWMADKHLRFYRVDRVWNNYNSFERVAKTGAIDEGSANLIARQWSEDELESDTELPLADRKWAAENDRMTAQAAAKGAIRPVDTYIRVDAPTSLSDLFATVSVGGRFAVTQSLLSKARRIDPMVTTVKGLGEVLVTEGYNLDRVDGKLYAQPS